MPKNVTLLTSAVGASIAIAFPGVSIAQGPQGALEEVVVVARKKEELSQDLPITIDALSGDGIKAAVIEDVTDLGRVVPGLVAQRNSQGGAPIYALRGTKTDNRIDGGVTVYLDDMPLVSNYPADHAFYDIASVEVLKGPQGTQFGANTNGGTISIRSKKPTDEFEAYVGGGVSDYDGWEYEGMVNIPVTDWMQVRLAGTKLERDGYIDNRGPGGPSKYNDENYYAYRASVRLTNNDNFTNDLIYDYYNADTTPRAPINVELIPDPLIGPAVWGAVTGKPFKVTQGTDPNSGVTPHLWTKNDDWGIQNITHWDFNSNWSVRNVIGYREDDDDLADNSDGTSLFLVSVRTLQDIKNKVDDFTLTYTPDSDKYSVSLGGYYQDYRKALPVYAQFAETVFLAGFQPPIPAGPYDGIQAQSATFKSEYKALYTNFDYKLSDTLTLTAGLRYNWDDVEVRFVPSGGVGVPYAGPFVAKPFGTPGVTPQFTVCTTAAVEVYDKNSTQTDDPNDCWGEESTSFNATSYNIAITSQVSDNTIVYAKASGGYQAGGYNTGVPGSAKSFKPEKTKAFEGGFKSDWELFNRPIRTNFAGFYGDTKNKQQVQNVTLPPDNRQQIGVFNAALLNFYGFDFQSIYNAFDGFDISLSWTHMEAQYENFVFPAIGLTPAQDFSNNTPAQMPEDTVTLSLSYEWPLSSDFGDVTSTISGYYTSDYTVQDVVNLCTTLTTGQPFCFPESTNKVDSYDVYKFYTSWNGVFGSNFDVSLWVDNLFDDNYIVRKNVQAGLGYRTYVYGDPRMYGLRLRYNFN